ncbi:MAG TPA: TonB-dependent receptor [Bryobacteraceae bacterium]|nr:TonB-dependent receptor [Bryobacteraceae bacterium]
MRLLFICCAWSVCAFAQQASITSLIGRVADGSGDPIPNASVKAVEVGTQMTYTGTTNEAGLYSFDLVRIGTYTITASAPGFGTVVHKSVVVEVNQVVRTNFELPVGQVSEHVTVSATPPPIATDDANLSEVLSEKTVSDLPLNGRDVLRMAALTPGVITGMKSRTGAAASGGEDFIGAGAREVQNSISLDGVSIVSNLITTTTLRPSVDATQEFQIQTGTYSAQYGTMIGVHLNVITKSGTNDLHGTGWEFVRNNFFDARDFFAPPAAKQPPYHQNQFGGELGGPVLIPKLYDGRNRTFFLVEYEGVRQSQIQSSLAAMFPVAYRTGDLSAVKTAIKDPLNGFTPFPNNIIPASELSPQAQKALAYMPLPNISGTSANNYQASAAVGNTTNQTLDRIDQNIGDKTRIFFRLAWQNASLLQGVSNPYNGFNVPLFDRNYAFGYTQTINPHAVNDFRFGYEKSQYQSINFFTTSSLQDAGTALGIPGFTSGAQDPGIPEFDISGYVSIGGQNMTSSNWTRPDSTFEWTDVLNYTFGAHTLSAGAEFFRLTTGSQGNNYQRGLFTFTGGITGNAAADFLLGLPLNDTTPGTAVLVLARQWRQAFFASDKWDVSPKLTLTLGLRYELPTVAQSPNGTIDFLNAAGTALVPSPPASVPLTNSQRNAFAPRLGFAYRLTDKWVVRGGAGIYYNANQLNSYTIGGGNPPFSNRTTYNSAPTNPTLSLSNPAGGSLTTASPTPNINTFPAYFPLAMMGQWSFDVERALWSGAGLDVQYLGSHTNHLDRNYYNNTPIPGAGAVQARRPDQFFGVIRTVANDVIENYDALNVILRQRFNHGLSMLLSYTWSHTLDVGTDSNNSGAGAAPQDPYDWKGDYGNSNWDIRHRFVASYSYELPFFHDGWKRYPLGGWQINGVTTIQSGTPILLSVSGDPANTGAPAPERPNLIAPAVANCGDGHLAGCIPVTSFAIPVQYTYGNAGRNTFKGPGLATTDLSLFKNFTLGTERAKLQLRLEGFNIFNTPSFSNPAAVFGTATFGSITSTLIPNRQIQLATKIIF